MSKAQQIIDAVIADHNCDRTEFFSRHSEAYLVNARVEAARRLRTELNLSSSVIARLLKRESSTIRYYLNPELRARKQAGPKAKWRSSQVLRFLDPDAAETVAAVAVAENTAPEMIIAQWVSERARYEAEAKARSAA